MRAGGSARAGTVAAVLAFLLWGLFPLYWKMLAAVPAVEVVAHRTAWGFVAVAAWVTLRGRWKDARSVASRPGTIARLAGSAVLIAVNWLLYVWAVVHDHVVEASLGYFINPLVNVLLGVLVLGERLSRAQRVAVALAAAGVAVLTVGHGRLPWIALALAVSFGLYGLARKTVGADAVVGLLWETGLLAPLAAGWLLSLEVRGSGAFGSAHPGTSGAPRSRGRGDRGAARALRAGRAVAPALDGGPPPVPLAEHPVPPGRPRLPRALHRRARGGVRVHLERARGPDLGPPPKAEARAGGGAQAAYHSPSADLVARPPTPRRKKN